MAKYICPECFEEVEYKLGDDPDNIICPNCQVLLELDYVDDLPNTEYFLVKKKREVSALYDYTLE